MTANVHLENIKEIKNAPECIVELYKHLGIFKNTCVFYFFNNIYIYIYKLSARFTRANEPRDQTENDTISNLASRGINLLAFYHQLRSLIGYATRYLFKQ